MVLNNIRLCGKCFLSLFSFSTSDCARESLGLGPCVCYTSARLGDPS